MSEGDDRRLKVVPPSEQRRFTPRQLQDIRSNRCSIHVVFGETESVPALLRELADDLDALPAHTLLDVTFLLDEYSGIAKATAYLTFDDE